MALIKKVRGHYPQFGQDCYLAENATIIGDVVMGDECSIWFNAVIRGDVNSIRMGNRVNIQDGAMVHCTFEQSATHIGHQVSIGHHAIIHGCTIKDHVLVGMGAIIMDHAIIESNVLVAAGALVLENMHLESGFIYGGSPARKLKPLGESLANGMIEKIASNYVKYASWYKE